MSTASLRETVLWSAGLAGALAIGGGCHSAAPPPPPPPAVTVAAVPTREITEWDEVSGRFQAVDAVEIRPRVSGYLRRVVFTEGKEVKKGDVLFEIDPRPYQAELARAEAALDQARSGATLAERDVERARRLVEVKAISQEEFDGRVSGSTQGSASVRAAEAIVTSARLNLEWTQVRSPINGRVGRAEVTQGNLVQAGPPAATLLTTVVSLDPIYVYFETDEPTFLKYSALARDGGSGPGSRGARTPIAVGLANEDGFPHTGYVDFLDNQLDSKTGTIRARAVFSNKDRMFTPGLFARLKLAGSDRHSATLILDRAVGTDQDKKFVFVVKADNTVDYRPVQIGRLVDGYRVVLGGLQPGEKIVINGLQRIRPGMHVTPTVAAMRADSGTVSAGAVR